METMERSKRRDRRSYTSEFKSEIVQRCRVLPAALGEDESAALTEDRLAALGVDVLWRRPGTRLPTGATLTHWSAAIRFS